MASTRTPQQTTRPSSNGQATRRAADLRPPGRRVRVPEMTIGVLVAGVFAVGALLWHLNSVDNVPALAVASQIQRGDVIESGDVRVVYVSSDDSLARFDDSQIDRVVGRVALVDLAPGTLFTPSVVADATTLGDGDAVVGLSLDPGAYPSRGLAPGDRVSVVRTGDAATGDGESLVVARNATVFEVEELATDRLLVSVLLAEADAESVASAAGAGNLRLVLVAP